MSNDIVTRLRNKYGGQLPICGEAADQIERLEADRDRWKNVAELAMQARFDDVWGHVEEAYELAVIDHHHLQLENDRLTTVLDKTTRLLESYRDVTRVAQLLYDRLRYAGLPHRSEDDPVAAAIRNLGEALKAHYNPNGDL